MQTGMFVMKLFSKNRQAKGPLRHDGTSTEFAVKKTVGFQLRRKQAVGGGA
jgi:hypothetical protein